ncbi:mercuric reductase [Deferribacter thermophilus]|uniref:mercuric reductase n=1 Tax=Deferribacter thermophilus TaxID=53573 RepID=UPI003C1DCEAF
MSKFDIYPIDEFNRKLLNNVHPENWENPTPAKKYNLVVIGAGTAGLISSIITASLGGKVALIEKELMGGDCLNVGCVPSKAILKSAKIAHYLKNASKYGFDNKEISSNDFPKVMERVRKIRAQISKNDSVKRYTDLGVDVFLGTAKFLNENQIEVDNKVLNFKKAIIATGAKAYVPDIPGLKENGYLTNETIFNLTTLPKHLLIIGGGPIGCEMAQAFRRLGAKVTIVEYSRLLAREDIEASEIIKKVFLNEGINILEHSQVIKVSQTNNEDKIITVKRQNETVEIVADYILVAAGRAPNVKDLNLEAAGIEYDERFGIKVNDFLQTSNKNIYAAGDCCMKWKFTHAADAAAQIAVQNALFKGKKRLSSLIMPWCTYTDPEVAHVGMYEEEASEKGDQTTTYKFDISENDRAQTESETTGFVKVLVKKNTDKILGATIVSSHAGEMINELTFAMVNNIGLGKINNVIHPYPTQSEAIKRVAGLYNKSRLTPFVAKLIGWWLKFQRR